jgi:hypothetical protein
MVFRRSGTVEKLGDVGGSLPRFRARGNVFLPEMAC